MSHGKYITKNAMKKCKNSVNTSPNTIPDQYQQKNMRRKKYWNDINENFEKVHVSSFSYVQWYIFFLKFFSQYYRNQGMYVALKLKIPRSSHSSSQKFVVYVEFR